MAVAAAARSRPARTQPRQRRWPAGPQACGTRCKGCGGAWSTWPRGRCRDEPDHHVLTRNRRVRRSGVETAMLEVRVDHEVERKLTGDPALDVDRQLI